MVWGGGGLVEVGYICWVIECDPASPEAAPRQAGVVRDGEWRLGAGSRHAGTGMLDSRQ